MQWRSTHLGVTAQFFLSYCCAGILAGIIALVLAAFHVPALTLIAGAGLAAGLAGLLLTFNIQRGLHRIERALDYLAQRQVVEGLEGGWQWPLSLLFTRVRQLRQTIEEQARREILTSEQRDQLLRTVSEAAVQEERNRLARELHDSIKQQIFSIGMSAAAIEARLSDGLTPVETPLADIQQSVQAAQSEMEALVQQLRPAPLSMIGVVENLRAQCQALAYRINGEAIFEVGELPSGERLLPTAADTLQRIVQEALSNIARHARARRVHFSIGQQENDLLAELRDDGQGFVVNERRRGMGLANMQARANSLGGNVQVQSRPGETLVSIRLPLVDELSPAESEQRRMIDSPAKRVQTWHKGANLLLQLTCLCILLALPFAPVGAGLCFTFICLALAYDSRRQLARLTTETSKEILALRNREYEGAASLLIVFSICVWYLPVALPERSPLLMEILAGAISCVALVFGLLACWKYRSNMAAYLRLLSSKERADEDRRLLVQLRSSLILWLVIALLALFIGQFNLSFPPRNAEQWSSDAIVALLICWPLIELASSLRGRVWARVLVTFKVKRS
jgi:signal transduction histidine kinase